MVLQFLGKTKPHGGTMGTNGLWENEFYAQIYTPQQWNRPDTG